MGYIRHDAIVVTASDYNNRLTVALEKAKQLGLPCSEIVPSPTNGYGSFLIAPDGSKEGWETSNSGNDAREAWKKWTNDKYIDWAHVTYGGDDSNLAQLTDHNDKELT